eukprot:7306437-Pyramimonas_sp.AAC.1
MRKRCGVRHQELSGSSPVRSGLVAVCLCEWTDMHKRCGPRFWVESAIKNYVDPVLCGPANDGPFVGPRRPVGPATCGSGRVGGKGCETTLQRVHFGRAVTRRSGGRVL